MNLVNLEKVVKGYGQRLLLDTLILDDSARIRRGSGAPRSGDQGPHGEGGR
jgi:hypothetical protein